ncbi:HPP family protein [Thiomicrorhabdus xiamenensis]|uniref:CBS domain-containing protein n=1 Tax=Thiomicrorhabdus xiamenensis TaxID=2739063 RepID=A0A7D4TEW5_9GAMM|nr:CBS domain-containing protein [Thiomicrorhabdus xiamenensis]QKI88328.1 CBS domain-containing protein [Thiomicrorhabdus xiamenensis]
MFAIYNIQGRRFRSSLEQLHKVHQPNAGQAPNLHEDVARDQTFSISGSDSEDTAETAANARHLQAYRKMLQLNERSVLVHAYQIMSQPVATLDSRTTLKQALEIFEKGSFQQMPVLNAQQSLVGLLTYQQLFKVSLHDRLPAETLVTEFMNPEVITVDPVSDVRRVAQVLYEYQLSALPVVNEQDNLVGIISKTDLLKALMMDPPLSLWV